MVRCFVPSLSSPVLCSSLYIFWHLSFSRFLFDSPTYINFVYLTFLWTFVDALFTLFIANMRSRGEIKGLSIIQALFSVSKAGSIVTLVLLGLRLEWVIASMISIELIFVIAVIYFIVRNEGFPVLNFEGLGGFLSFSIPQIPIGILGWIMSASDRYFITHFLNLSQTGIYSSSNYLAGLIALFYSPIGYVLLPTVSKTWEQKRKGDTKNYFEYSTRLFLTLAIPATVGLTMLSQSLLKILATSEYLAGMELVLLIGISQIFYGMFLINTYIVYLVKRTKWLLPIFITSSSISIGLNAILIPSIGITGAAISKIVAYFVLTVIVTIWIKKAMYYNIDIKYIAKVFIATLIMAISIYFLQIGGIKGIILSIIIGVPVFVITLHLLKAFTEQDKRLIKQTFSGMIPQLH